MATPKAVSESVVSGGILGRHLRRSDGVESPRNIRGRTPPARRRLVLSLVLDLLPVFLEGLVAEVGVVVAVVAFGAAMFGYGAGEGELHLIAELLDFVLAELGFS